MNRFRTAATVAGLAFLLSHSLQAAEPAATPAATATTAGDPEEQLDDGLKNFGYLTGLAHGCVVEEQRTVLEREALELNAGIARLLGIDRSFLFTAAFGYGTTVAVETKDCPAVLERYEARVAGFRAGQGGAK